MSHKLSRPSPLLRAIALVAVSGLFPVETSAQQGAIGGEWRSYAADSWGTKYSALDQITTDNFSDLELAWTWETADSHLMRTDDGRASLVPSSVVFDLLEAEDPDRWVTRPRISRLAATPLMVGGVLYVSTPIYQAAAIDARTGRTLWVHDPKMYESGTPVHSLWGHRGVAYWENGGDARIVWGTGDGYLVAVDAKTGLPAEDFGHGGRVDLMENLPRATRGQRDNLNLLPISSLSAPMIVRDTIIIGSSIHDFTNTKEGPPGYARAYDARTGRHKWDFHLVPQSADEELGYVYLPTSTPTSDYYGGHRPGDNLFAESLVCVDIETGRRVWHYQLVHHGVWDYDSPTAPNLLDITETNLEGEILSPTQPIPSKPEAFDYRVQPPTTWSTSRQRSGRWPSTQSMVSGWALCTLRSRWKARSLDRAPVVAPTGPVPRSTPRLGHSTFLRVTYTP